MGNSISGQGSVVGCQDAHIQYQAQWANYYACLSAASAVIPVSSASQSTPNTQAAAVTPGSQQSLSINERGK